MRKYEKITKTIEENQLLECKCDLCGTTKKHWTFDQPHYYGTYNQISISHRYGTCYPEFHDSTTESYDVCPSCWVNTIQPLFGNVEPYIQEYEY